MILSKEQQAEALAAVSRLIGLGLIDMYRYGCQALQFGDIEEEECEDPVIWTLILSCPWKFGDGEDFQLSSDLFGDGDVRHDSHAESFYEQVGTASLTVMDVRMIETGGFEVGFAGGITLSVTPSPKRIGEDSNYLQEHWRLMSPEIADLGHFVLFEQIPERTLFGWSGPVEGNE